jgi:hypothetical protein
VSVSARMCARGGCARSCVRICMCAAVSDWHVCVCVRADGGGWGRSCLSRLDIERVGKRSLQPSGHAVAHAYIPCSIERATTNPRQCYEYSVQHACVPLCACYSYHGMRAKRGVGQRDHSGPRHSTAAPTRPGTKVKKGNPAQKKPPEVSGMRKFGRA